MSIAKKLMKMAADRGLEVGATTKTTKDKVKAQASAMLDKLAKKDVKLDYTGSNQIWWNGKSVAGKRMVKIYYDGRVVSDFSLWSEDGVDGIKKTINDIVAMVDDTTDEDWKSEEDRRKEPKK